MYPQIQNGSVPASASNGDQLWAYILQSQ